MGETATWAAVRRGDAAAGTHASIAAPHAPDLDGQAAHRVRVFRLRRRCAPLMGQCPSCGEWNTLTSYTESRATRARDRAGPAATAQPIARLVGDEEARLATGFAEFDRVLGGGIVAGSVILIGGDPGIGKSTLLLQCAAALSKEHAVLYATGEESVRQVADRARRLAVDADKLALVAETGVERILALSNESGARIVVIDSIQTMSVADVEAAPGAVTQLRESTAALVRHAKATGTAVLLIGHVTREGVIAGPRVLEHMVDTVLYFESDSAAASA